MNTISVEVVLNNTSKIAKTSIIQVARHYLNGIKIRGTTVLTEFDRDLHPVLHSEAQAIIIDETPECTDFINFDQCTIAWYVYTLDPNGPMNQMEESEDENEMLFASHLMLPSAELFNLWENLYYESNVKENLLSYGKTMMRFSDHGVDDNIVNCNRVILLHGPPGTGKTSLCKALANKLSIRLQDRFTSGVLIEINSHSLFSKWFSESGKLVTRMFTKIGEIVENPNLLVCVLIDEVESLAHARNICISGNEPSDAVRVVNAVLTQIDQIKRHPNVLILTTSNMTESIDLAFIDRADIKQYLGMPTPAAIYQVYYSCIEELIKSQIIKEDNDMVASPHYNNSTKLMDCESKNTIKLLEVCRKSEDLSGRCLRKIPFIAHALFTEESSIPLNRFLGAMADAVEREKAERKFFETRAKRF